MSYNNFINILSILITFNLISTVYATECDKTITPEIGENGYQYRPNPKYCEGMYRTNVNADLRILSFYSSDQDNNITNQLNTSSIAHNLEVKTKFLDYLAVKIRARSLSPLIQYQLDKELSKNAFFIWTPPAYISEYVSGGIGFYGFFLKEHDPLYVSVTLSKASIRPKNRPQNSAIITIRTPVSLDAYSWIFADKSGEIIASDYIEKEIRRNASVSINVPKGFGELKLTFSGERRRSERPLSKTFRVQAL